MTEDHPGTTPIEDLLKSFKVTAGCRFNAARRLEEHDEKLTRLTAFASAYIIALTVMPYFVNLPKPTSEIYNLVTVSLSIIILVSSLLQYSSGDAVNAEQHHRSALEINELRRLLVLRVENNVTEAEIKDFIGRYNAVLQKYSINHQEVDIAKYQLEHREMYPWLNWEGRLRIYIILSWRRHFLSVVLFIMTSCMVGLVVFSLVQANVFGSFVAESDGMHVATAFGGIALAGSPVIFAQGEGDGVGQAAIFLLMPRCFSMAAMRSSA